MDADASAPRSTVALSFALIQVDADPNLWREQLDISAAAHEAGSRLYPQIAARPFGMLLGFPGHHAFTHRPTYRRLKAECTREELAAAAGRTRRAGRDSRPRTTCPSIRTSCSTACSRSRSTRRDRLYAMGDPPDYEPTAERTVEAIARNAARTRWPRCTT